MPGTVRHANHEAGWNRRRIAALALLFLVIGGVIMFRRAGHWLVRADSPSNADVIVILSGGMPYRAEGAANIFKMGYAPEIWVSRPESPAANLEAFGIHFVGEDEYNRQILIHLGIPESAVHVFPDPIMDTEQEVAEIAREMRRTGKKSALIVTSPQHTRRVSALWRKLAGEALDMRVCAASQDPFDADHWWRNTRDALSVVREYLGLANVWAGLPVRPASN